MKNKNIEPVPVKTSDQVWDEAMTPMIKELPYYADTPDYLQAKINELVKAVNRLQRP